MHNPLVKQLCTAGRSSLSKLRELTTGQPRCGSLKLKSEEQLQMPFFQEPGLPEPAQDTTRARPRRCSLCRL